jgi:transposase
VVTALDAGLSPGEASCLFGVDLSTVYRWHRRARRGESLAEQPRSGRPPKLAPTRYAEVREVILASPVATLPEHAARLATTTGIRLSPSHFSRVVRRLARRLKERA